MKRSAFTSDEVKAHFVELEPRAGQSTIQMQCKYCGHTAAKNITRHANHLEGCRSFPGRSMMVAAAASAAAAASSARPSPAAPKAPRPAKRATGTSKRLFQPLSMSSPNGEPYFRPVGATQALANYPHARIINDAPRIISGGTRNIFVSGTSSRRGDGTFAGTWIGPDGSHVLDCGEQTAAVLKNIESILQGASDGQVGLDGVVDATVFLTDMDDYEKMNVEWNKAWPDQTKAPARTCVEVVALPNELINVEIKCQAVIPA